MTSEEFWVSLLIRGGFSWLLTALLFGAVVRRRRATLRRQPRSGDISWKDWWWVPAFIAGWALFFNLDLWDDFSNPYLGVGGIALWAAVVSIAYIRAVAWSLDAAVGQQSGGGPGSGRPA